MRTLVLIAWLMVPLALAAYHYGPGQERLRLDDVAGCLSAGARHAERWEIAANEAPGARLPRQRRESGLAETQPRVRVLQDIADLRRLQPHIHGNGD